MIVTPRCFSAEVLRRGLRTFITSNVIWIKIRFPLFVITNPYTSFLSLVLQCHVVRCQSVDVCRTHHWKLRCKPWWADMSKTSRIDQQLVLLSFPLLSQIGTRLIFPIHRVPTFLAVFQWKISRLPHLRIQSCSLEINLAAVRTCLVSKFHQLVYCCHSHWFLSPWISTFPCLCLSLRFVRLLVPTISCFVPILSRVSTFTFESWVFCCRSSVIFAWVAFFSFLATLLAFDGFFFAFPFPGDGIDSHWIFVVCVSGWSRLEDASAPQVIFSRHA